MTPRWYLARLRTMTATEIVWRARNAALHRRWRRRVGGDWPTAAARPRWIGGSFRAPRPDLSRLAALTARAGIVLSGRWQALGATFAWDGAGPDWFRDPVTGVRAPADTYCFDIAYRDELKTGNVKAVWELSRLHHVTLLASAFHHTAEPAFARTALAHLGSWWAANPPLRGVHWVSGIEVGLRLIAFVWTRRLLSDHGNIAKVFEDSPTFQRQLHAHQLWIATFQSGGTSANNHLIAEAAGQFVAATCFPLFAVSGRWAAGARVILEREIERQTFPDGMHREIASAYHVFVLELLLIATIEAERAKAPFSDGFMRRLRLMADALAASVDPCSAVPRQGDGDDGRALVLDGARDAAATVLAVSAALFGAAPWWPERPAGDLAAAMLGSLISARPMLADAPRAAAMPSWFPGAGIAILRDHAPGPGPGSGAADPAARRTRALWCRFDAGPHGFLATAAHAHADALSFELRIGGQPVLVDPGTYCYHGERAWRDYFRSTVGHNALELDGRDQAEAMGPFLWRTHPDARAHQCEGLDGGDVARVTASHDGYGARHHREVTLCRHARTFTVRDWIEGARTITARLAFHLHPDVSVLLTGADARLSWAAGAMTLRLSNSLSWTAHCGETAPILGWYSPAFGQKVPTTTLLGTGRIGPGQALVTTIACAARAGLRDAA